MAEVQERIGQTEWRLAEIESESAGFLGGEITKEQVAAARAELETV